MTLHLIHSLHSSPCPSFSFPLLWVHLSSHFLKRASRPSHPFHLGRIHPYPPLEPGATWRSCLRLWPHLRNEERPRSSGGAEMRRSPLVAAWRVSRNMLRAGRGAERDKSHWVSWCLLSSLPSRVSFSCAWLPHFQPGLNPTGSVTVSCSPSMETWPWIQASQQILQQMVVLMPFTFTPLHSVTPTHALLPCLLVPITRVSFSFFLFFYFLFQSQLIRKPIEWSIQ